MQTIHIETQANKQMIDITKKIQAVIRENNWKNGIITIFSAHTTAAITINENADPDVERDILQHVQKLIPRNAEFKHAEGNSDSHILTSLFGLSEQVILVNGKIQLGTWQSVFFCEFDGPRNRKVWIEFIEK